MALYLGSDKVNANLDSVAYIINFFATTLILNGIMLLSSDDYALLDSNGLYITAKESE